MANINLTAKGRDQELILAYLQDNASEVLTDKINNGTPYEKDGKHLTNRKDLDGFMKYACDEARKQAAKGSNSACVEDAVVYGWAIHYFEEDSIVGKLFNQDGTEYKPPAPVKTPKPIPTKSVTPPKPKSQFSFFDMLDEKKAEVKLQADEHEVVDNVTQQDEPTIDQIADSLQTAIDEKHGVKSVEPVVHKKEVSQYYSQYTELKETYPDCIILIRLGDFYEAFNDDAETLSDELDLTLTGRNVGLESRVPMVGFPYHVCDNYIDRIRKNHSVVIVEVNGDVVTLKKTEAPVVKDDLDDDEEEIEELSEQEMQEFDGDIQEPTGIPKAVLSEEAKDGMKYILTKEDIAFEPSVLKRLHEILGDVLA